MTGWSLDLPRIPGHYWVRVPGFERAPDIEHVEDFGDGLVVRDDTGGGEWRPLADVWGGTGARWWGPLMPPDLPPPFDLSCNSANASPLSVLTRCDLRSPSAVS